MATITTTCSLRIEDRVTPELPQGVQRWWANGEVLGDGVATEMRLQINFNISADPAFTPYVAVNFASMRSTIVEVGPMELVMLSNQWERNADPLAPMSAPILRLDPIVTSLATVFTDTYTGPVVYLGRGVTGSTAAIRAQTININTAVIEFQASGFLADRPFVPFDFWR